MGDNANAVGPETQLPDLFRTHPETRAIFNRHGLRGCGGQHGPAESVGFFAEAHGLDTERMLAEIRQVISDPAARQAARDQLAADRRPHLGDTIYQPFFLAGLAVIVSVGAAWGTWLLVEIGRAESFTGISIHEVNAHGHAQIMGWVGLFIMGFAYQAFPRMWQVNLPAPRVALLTLGLLLVGMAFRCTAMAAAGASWSVGVHRIGAAAEVVAAAGFVGLVVTTFARSKVQWTPYLGFVFTALACFLIQAIYSAWHMDRLLTAPTRETLLYQLRVYQGSLRDLQIHGMGMLMILGVGIRRFPTFFDLPEISPRRGWTAFGILLTALVSEVALMLAYQASGDHRLAAALLAPWLMLPVGAATAIWPWRLWRRLPASVAHDRSGKFVRAAFAWLFVSLAMLVLLPVYQAVSGIPFSHAYYGAVRHAITVGFISMMIVGMASRVAATLRGFAPERLPGLWFTFIVLNVGCFWRVVSQVLTDSLPGFYTVIVVSGALEWTALTLWACHLCALMRGWGRYADVSPTEPAAAESAAESEWGPIPSQIEPGHRVAAVLTWHPELEEVFFEHGFEMLRNPMLRNTVAREVSLQQVCLMRGVNLDQFLEALRAKRTHRTN